MNPYSYTYKNGIIPVEFKLKSDNGKYSCYNIEFQSAFEARHIPNTSVHGQYYRPRGVLKAPLVILVHGMGPRGDLPCHWLARSLVQKGFACFVVYQIFHSKRAPESIKNRLNSLSSEEWFESYQVSVIDVRQILDWAGSAAEIDTNNIAVVGISFGGFISTIAMGIDERIKAGVFIATGGNSSKITYKARRRFSDYRYTTEQYNQVQKEYSDYLSEVADKGYENVIPTRPSFLNDPMTFGQYLRRRPVLFLGASWDDVIPKEATLDLWAECGKKEISWLPGTHASIWLWYPLIARKVSSFLTAAIKK